MLRSLSYLVAIFALFGVVQRAQAVGPKAPEGEWTMQVKPSPNNTLKHTTEAYTDTVTIKDGKFITEVNAKYGFEPVPCTVKIMRGKTYVVALLNDEKHGKTEYQLIFSGKDLSGQMRWGKQGEDGKPKYAEYSVTGMKK